MGALVGDTVVLLDVEGVGGLGDETTEGLEAMIGALVVAPFEGLGGLAAPELTGLSVVATVELSTRGINTPLSIS